ncbi:MAG TPA: alpha-amylase family glycosyl hydrolase [Lentimicrobium sp.]|nr:alpha-amylase family glycosyl hydrolase [Lentimicrobium sp.]
MENFIPGIIEKDPWLTPVTDQVISRIRRFNDRLTEIEHLFGSIEHFADGYHYFGVNFDSKKNGWYYREWAPEAFGLYLSGDFNNWNNRSHPLTKKEFGVWEIFLPFENYKDSFKHGTKIKVWVEARNGFLARIPAYITRVLQDEDTKNYSGQLWFTEYNWNKKYLGHVPEKELFIYECHIGMSQEKEGVGTYREFAINNLPWIKELGYNAIQVMAIQEHPYYGSFGYHVSNFYAPSSRFGDPEDLKFLIETAHKMGISVIMDIVHSHTVKNINEGLNQFDGTDYQYFHEGDRGIHPQWDSLLFDYGKLEVIRFLLSNIKYWIEEYKIDGFRFDGVGSMMYFHHGNSPISSQIDYFENGVEWDAVTYLQLANHLTHKVKPNAITIAEDVTGMPGLTFNIDEGGIGFDFRLGMGIPDFWIKLLKESKDEDWNISEIWHVLNNRLPGVNTVAYAESHDQALVGDKTLAFWLMDKYMYWHMAKDDDNLIIDRGIALHKLLRFITLSLGGSAYLNFMGNEFGHPEWIDFPREGNNWSFFYARRQWSLKENPDLKYHLLSAFDKDMIHVAKEKEILNYEFAQLLNVDDNNKTLIFSKNNLIFLFNLHPFNSIPNYSFYVPEPGAYKVVLCTDNKKYGGHNRLDEAIEYSTFLDEDSNVNKLSIYLTNRTGILLEKK